MTALDIGFAIAGFGLIALALGMLATDIGRLAAAIRRQELRIAQLERDVKDATVLARRRIAAGRSGRWAPWPR